MVAAGPDQRFPRVLRIRRRSDYLEIQNGGRRVSSAHLLVFVTAGRGRLGVTVSRKVGDAVRRNRVKRWIRECFRRGRQQLPTGLDLVVVARQGAATAGQGVLCDELYGLARRFAAPSPSGRVSR